ncbi:MAG: hypothetical protein AB7N80_02560 [Bdellovibrionales bacterium]
MAFAQLRYFSWRALAVSFVLVPAQAFSATITAVDCNMSSVQAAVTAAADGDIVVIPSGNCSWTSGINIRKQITLSGQSKGSVLITHNAGSATLLNVDTGSQFNTVIRYLNFLPGNSSGGRYLAIGGSGKAPLVYDNYFRIPNFLLLHAIAHYRNGGVYHHNTFESLDADGTSSGSLQLAANGDTTSWSRASSMGSRDTDGSANTYIEDNVFKNITLQAVDCDNNARSVIRHNKFDNSGFVCHGADTSEYGARHTEVYNNTFIFTATPSGGINYPFSINWWWYVRGGTGVVTDNIMPDINSQTWSNKPELAFIVQQLARNAGPDACCKTYPCLNQVGQSHNGTARVAEPLYVWNNSGTGKPETPGILEYTPDECGNGLKSADFIKVGRDFISGIPKPNYTKYIYPHPLVSGYVPPPSAGKTLKSTKTLIKVIK